MFKNVLTLGCSDDTFIAVCNNVIGNFGCGLELSHNLKSG